MKHENLHVLLLTIKNKALHIRIGKIYQLVRNDTLLNFKNNIKKKVLGYLKENPIVLLP